jgi:phosphoribosylglycinamide formyltransferase-1
MTERHRVAILISARSADFPAEIALVLSNRPDAAGLGRAGEAGVEALVIDHKHFSNRESFDEAVDEALRARAIDFVCLAGFMRVLTSGFVERWAGRMLNIHPSLLPLFRGTHTHQRALQAGVLVHGCTVHFVVPELDAGPIIAQAAVPVVPGDTEASLAARILVQEHRLYPEALRMLCKGEARLEGERVWFQQAWSPDGALRSPG